jgi:hypothetical protein
MPFDELLNTLEPKLAEAFRQSIQAIRNNVILARVVEKLERGDINGAIAALQIEPEAFAALDRSILDAYNAGGVAAVGEYPKIKDPVGNRVLFSFGVRNEAGEAALRQLSSSLITGISDDSKEGARITLASGLEAGRNPKSTALDLVGRVDPITKLRQGGTIGLTSAQTAMMEKYRAAMLSGDETLLRAYLELGTRDKRFDRTIAAAIASGRPMPMDTVQRIIGRLSDNNLKLRGETIGQNETMNALSMARDDAIRQQINGGKVASTDITKTWKLSISEHKRLQHVAFVGKAMPVDEAFIAADGTPIMYPHAPGLPAKHALGCKCRIEYQIDFIGAAARRYRAQAA